jgi:hypothetical protein
MKNITDDDLTLLYYGEHDEPGLAAIVAASPALSARFEALSAELDWVDELEPPERGEEYGAEVWRRISPRLVNRQAGSRWRTLLSGFQQPRFSLAGAFSVVLVAVLAFTLGRQSWVPETMETDVSSVSGILKIEGSRLLTSSVSGHLDQLNLVFTQFANSPDGSATKAERVTDLLVANRLYRKAAESRGNRQMAAFLAELEPLLIELAHEAHMSSDTTRERMQQEVRDRLLFRVRIMNKQLENSNIAT